MRSEDEKKCSEAWAKYKPKEAGCGGPTYGSIWKAAWFAALESSPNTEPVAFINYEKRCLEFANPPVWETPTIAKLDRVPLFSGVGKQYGWLCEYIGEDTNLDDDERTVLIRPNDPDLKDYRSGDYRVSAVYLGSEDNESLVQMLMTLDAEVEGLLEQNLVMKNTLGHASAEQAKMAVLYADRGYEIHRLNEEIKALKAKDGI